MENLDEELGMNVSQWSITQEAVTNRVCVCVLTCCLFLPQAAG